jgi:hypothetical protein
MASPGAAHAKRLAFLPLSMGPVTPTLAPGTVGPVAPLMRLCVRRRYPFAERFSESVGISTLDTQY